jgi:hypothetical protein
MENGLRPKPQAMAWKTKNSVGGTGVSPVNDQRDADLTAYFSQNGQASGGQSGGQSRQHSELGQLGSGAVTSACGTCSVDFPVRLEAANAPAATSGTAASENHNHFLLLMGSPSSKMTKNTSRSLTPTPFQLFNMKIEPAWSE